MTMTPQPPALRQPRTWAQAVHSAGLHISVLRGSLQRDLTGILHSDLMKHIHGIEEAAEHVIVHAERVVDDPVLDDVIEAVLQARAAGVAAEVFQTLTAGLRAAVGERQAAASVPDADSRLHSEANPGSKPESGPNHPTGK